MMKKIAFIFCCACFVYANECENRVFPSLSTSKGVTIAQMIDRLSDNCGFSVIVKDNDAEQMLSKQLNTTNLKNFKLKNAFDYFLGENGFSYTFANNTLTIKYTITKTFKVDYIATARKGQSSVQLAGQSTSSGSQTTTQNSSNQQQSLSQNTSSTTIQMTDDFRFWGQIESEIRQILDSKNKVSVQNSIAIPAVLSQQEMDKIKPGTDISSLMDSYSTNLPQQGNMQKSSGVIVNKEAGLITIISNKDGIKEVEEYLSTVMDRLHKQVFIDVEILQVDLSNGSQVGIDWSQLSKIGGTLSFNDGTKGQSSSSTTNSGNFIQFTGSMTIPQILAFLNTQGNVRAVSNPKAMTLNNQPAMIFSGKIVYYPNVSGGTSGTATAGATNPNVTATPLQVGVSLDITPEVQDDNEIMLKINPSISACEVSGCPLQQISVAGQSYSLAPNIAQQQLASLVKVNSGERVVLGGLIRKENSTSNMGLPLLSSIPLLGRLFSKNADSDSTSELVIVITPNVVQKAKPLSIKQLGYGKEMQEDANVK